MRFLAPKVTGFDDYMMDRFMNKYPELYGDPKAENDYEDWLDELDWEDICEYADQFAEEIKND